MRLEVVGEIVSRSPPELRDEPFCAEADVLKARVFGLTEKSCP